MSNAPVMSITDELVAELESLASKATGGEWEYHMGLIRTMADSDGYVPVAVAPNAPKNWRGQRDTNMKYIAAANPDVLRALLSERAELLRDANCLRWLLDQGDNTQWQNILRIEVDDYATVRDAINEVMRQEAKP